MKNINISILIANYNGEKYLDRCLNSCINQQTKKNYEPENFYKIYIEFFEIKNDAYS